MGRPLTSKERCIVEALLWPDDAEQDLMGWREARRQITSVLASATVEEKHSDGSLCLQFCDAKIALDFSCCCTGRAQNGSACVYVDLLVKSGNVESLCFSVEGTSGLQELPAPELFVQTAWDEDTMSYVEEESVRRDQQ